jgi:hypothetical protein
MQETKIHDAEVRWYPAGSGTDDRSDMYVLEVLGVTLLVRKRGSGRRHTETYVHVESRAPVVLEVNNGGTIEYG